MTSETTGFNPKKYLYKLLSDVSGKLYLKGESAVMPAIEITFPEPGFGDFSTNLSLRLAKIMKLNPVELAPKMAAMIAELDREKYFETVDAAGGFVNFKLSPKVLLGNLSQIITQGDLYGCSVAGEGKSILVEYFQNNVAKPPHVGHLRSAVIGDCLLRVLRSQGYKAISDTHIGDWGTQFGILLYAFKTMGNRALVEKDPINELNKLYVEMSAKIEADPTLHEKGKEEFAKLEKGDTENRELWQWFVRVSLEDFDSYRDLLDILPFDHNLGESFYEDKMQPIIADLKSKNLLVESEGAQIVNLEDAKLGIAVLVKSDGATTYLMRDLATVKYRVDALKVSKALYVADNRQSHHFEQFFEISKRAGYIQEPKILEHVDFGFMSLPEGVISTRKGTTISLQNLIDEAQKRALAIINEKNPELANKEAIAKMVALAAIKYFDLSHNRKTEIVFTWDKALSFEGNTGPYLQYTYARIQGILRKAGVVSPFMGSPKTADKSANYNSHELAVLRKLIQFPEAVTQVTKDYLPNGLCTYLFELSQTFNAFYQEVPVLQEPDSQIKDFRLKLITATAQVLQNGLYLLGIEAPEEM